MLCCLLRRWYEREGPLRGTGAPVVAVLLYRKHVITEQQYIPQLIRQMESEGLLPLPIFINGVEAHTVVRDQLSSRHEQELIKRGEAGSSSSLKRDAVVVEAVVNTIGFPLVGGPAGEAALQAVAQLGCMHAVGLCWWQVRGNGGNGGVGMLAGCLGWRHQWWWAGQQ
jgi:cobalamin biosynthesis Mg chelatase CobN